MKLETVRMTSINNRDYYIVSVQISRLEDPDNCLGFHFGFGLIPKEFVGSDGRLTNVLSLASLLYSETIPECIDRQLDMDNTKGLTQEQMIEYFRAKYRPSR